MYLFLAISESVFVTVIVVGVNFGGDVVVIIANTVVPVDIVMSFFFFYIY